MLHATRVTFGLYSKQPVSRTGKRLLDQFNWVVLASQYATG